MCVFCTIKNVCKYIRAVSKIHRNGPDLGVHATLIGFTSVTFNDIKNMKILMTINNPPERNNCVILCDFITLLAIYNYIG